MAEYDNSGTLLRSYIHGQGIDEPIRITDHSTSTSYYYLADGLGSIVEMQDASGNLVESYKYDSFGNPTIKDSTGTTIPQSAIHNPYMFTSREWNAETGLYYYRSRYYDSSVGRFLSKDPEKKSKSLDVYNPYDFADSILEINGFIYAMDNPINKIDPSGRKVYRCTRKIIGPIKHVYVKVSGKYCNGSWGFNPRDNDIDTLNKILDGIPVPGKVYVGETGGNCSELTKDDCKDKCVCKTAANFARPPWHEYRLGGYDCIFWAGMVLGACGL